MNRPLIVSFAQNREDIIIRNIFKGVNKGFYVDVGANHPVEDSVTKIFYMNGWTGINIEPNNKLYRTIKADRPKDININVGVGNKPGELIFREYSNHGLSTFSKGMQKNYELDKSVHTDTFNEYKVKIQTLAEIFEENRVKKIDFLKIDIEGFEYEALQGNDWDKYRPELICIESNHIVKDWRPMLKKHGYTKVFFDGLNDYYLAKESGLHDTFSYVDAFLLEGEVVTWEKKTYIDELLTENKLLSSKLKSLKSKQKKEPKRESIKVQIRKLYTNIDYVLVCRLSGGRKRFDFSKLDINEDLKKSMISHYIANQPSHTQRTILAIYRVLQQLLFLPLRARKLLRGRVV